MKDFDKNGYFVVRTNSAGVFAGEITRLEGTAVEMTNARRIWYWEGAASLSELSLKGVKYPDKCKFPDAVDYVLLFEVIEILRCTPEAEKSIKDVPIWSAHESKCCNE